MKTLKFKDTLISYLFLLPFLIIFAVFLAYPFFYALYLSFHEVSVSSSFFNIFSEMRFKGFQNYITLLKDKEFWWSLIITAYYAVLSIPLSITFSLTLATILNNRLKGATIFRTAYFLPFVLDTLVISLIWVLLYSPHYGIIIRILEKLGVDKFTNTGILGQPKTALLGIVVALTLKNAGFGMILFLSAIQNIPQSVYEAADIDGVNPWQRLIYVTLPLLRPIILFLVIIGVMGALNSFTEIYITTRGGPEVSFTKNPIFGTSTFGVTRVSGFYLFQNFERMRYGYSCSIAYVLLIITLIISFINARILRKKT